MIKKNVSVEKRIIYSLEQIKIFMIMMMMDEKFLIERMLETYINISFS